MKSVMTLCLPEPEAELLEQHEKYCGLSSTQRIVSLNLTPDELLVFCPLRTSGELIITPGPEDNCASAWLIRLGTNLAAQMFRV